MQKPAYKSKFASTLALVAILSACGNPAEQPNEPPRANAQSSADAKNDFSAKPPKTNAVAPPANAEKKQPVQDGTSIKETLNPQPQTSEETKQTPLLYTMNAAYRFDPIAGSGAAKKAVLLTFDDGPKDEKTLKAMLDTLDKHQAKAIFFVNGYRVKAKPELLKLIASRGQTIGNHSWDHVDLKKEDEQAVRKQIGDVQTIVKETTGQTPRYFRPPFGSGGDLVKKIAADSGLLFMTWSNGSLDWDASSKDKPKNVIKNVMEQLHPGANILMHELPWTKDALDSLLTQLKEKGYGFIDPAAIDATPKAKPAK
ncbi:polysaccharide deacetylase family protein [Paenibacillus xanthanilyticus]|uniref:Polysaccharide deacetylase family protein n=1 Tax=Paenibacillus xanthanilyticus TaxID=1783531 RepID=A0ABV8KCH9_9BACL